MQPTLLFECSSKAAATFKRKSELNLFLAIKINGGLHEKSLNLQQYRQHRKREERVSY